MNRDNDILEIRRYDESKSNYDVLGKCRAGDVLDMLVNNDIMDISVREKSWVSGIKVSEYKKMNYEDWYENQDKPSKINNLICVREYVIYYGFEKDGKRKGSAAKIKNFDMELRNSKLNNLL